jgi:arylsulfatase A-like enzyme
MAVEAPEPAVSAASRVPFLQLLAAGALTGVVAAAATGVLDGLWTWGRLTQFVPGFGSKLRLLVYLAASHALVGFLVGVIAAAVGGFYMRVTRFGDLVRHARAEHARTRAEDPRRALVGLSLVVFIPIAAVLLYVAHVVLVKQVGARKHPGLVLAVTMGSTIVTLAIAAALAIALARLVELILSAAVSTDRNAAHALASPLAPPIAAAVLVANGALAIVFLSWKTLKLLHLRPFVVALLALALVAPAYLLVGRRGAARWQALPRNPRIGVAVGMPIVLFVLAALTGASPSVIKAAVAYSGGGDIVTQSLKATFDLDRDGHSALFGGDDCDDLDKHIHPGATDIPDDGVDQNCVAGDAKLKRSVDELGFVQTLPAGLPPDWNLVLITIDTLRADHVGAYGYKRATTPTLDSIANDGALFEAAWAHAPSTRYSMPALLTGRLPLDVFYDTSVQGWPGLLPKATTLAEVLKPRGFTTGAITNYWYFDRSRHMNQGFDSYDNSNASLHQGSDPAHTKGSSSAQQTDKALAFVQQHAAERFFLWVHYYDPHHEYEAHPGVQSFGSAPMDLYDQEILFTDQQIGRLVEDLRTRGLWQKTVVVVTGDHGEGFGEHGIMLHGYDLYAAQTKVPLIVRLPNVKARRVKTAAGHVDVMPTLANLAGAPPSTEMMGRSLVPWIDGSAPDDLERPVFQQLSYEGNHEKRGASTSHCHVLYNISPHTSWEMYDVSRDAGETRDISGNPGACAKTRAAFESWYDAAQIPPGAADALLAAKPTVAAPLDIDLGPEARLLSVDMPAQVHPGDTFDITWTYEARGRLDPGWRVFVHFEDGRGGRFTADHAPVRPFEWWQRGQYIRYTTSATIPATAPPGTYGMWIGLWRKQARRPVKAPAQFKVVENRVRAASIEVVR